MRVVVTTIRDIDLVAVPWTPKAIDAGTLIKHLAEIEGVTWSSTMKGKPHGRLATTFYLRLRRDGDPLYIDLSALPRQGDW